MESVRDEGHEHKDQTAKTFYDLLNRHNVFKCRHAPLAFFGKFWKANDSITMAFGLFMVNYTWNTKLTAKDAPLANGWDLDSWINDVCTTFLENRYSAYSFHPNQIQSGKHDTTYWLPKDWHIYVIWQWLDAHLKPGGVFHGELNSTPTRTLVSHLISVLEFIVHNLDGLTSTDELVQHCINYAVYEDHLSVIDYLMQLSAVRGSHRLWKDTVYSRVDLRD